MLSTTAHAASRLTAQVGFTASNPMMFNRYAYGNNNPYKYVDPDGMEVRAIFDLSIRTLSMRDLDRGNRVVVNAFSGGTFFHGSFEPIPGGRYAILSHPDEDRYRLEALDSNFGDDIQESSGRSLFRLHHYGSGVSEGCIAASDDDGWEQIDGMLQNTSTRETIIDSKSRNRFASRTESATVFGRLMVIDTSGRIESQKLKEND
ncbi:hypothetical protein CWE13_11220 [Aliidiomarina shirensis]|uniref:DUF2778 domain-containing protein n=1 Tax=Aliidiomarina shirensis TaxID=1048642 RepID=A0A432WNX7_9GAMM|nr:DUF2778 domain-containing protein [Aliidiomarina shirensis]RUO35493.1 hypothetical protein CWE13_11220 [Aliidiomarina shirensis]